MARVLLVEDEASLREIIAEALADCGHQPTVAENGVHAIRRLAEQEFDVVITDISMPEGVSGLDLVDYMRAAGLTPKIILVSGHARAQLPHLPGEAAFLPKPYRIVQLLELLKD